MEKDRNKSYKLKYILIFIGIILVIFVSVIGYLVVKDLEQEDILKKEIVNLANMDLVTGNYDVEVKTTGDYAYIEEAIKTYYKKLSDSVKVINNYLNDEELINILSASNLESDGPNFERSYKILSDTREMSNQAMATIINLCSEETIKGLIDKKKVDSYSFDLYLELMYTEDDLKNLEKTKTQMQVISTNLNTFLDKVEAMIKMLETNSGYWFIDEGQLYFEKDSLVTEYNNLYSDLNNFVNENFDDSNNTGITRTNSNV